MKGRRLVAGGGLGAAAGLAGVVGTSLLYQGLAIGRMSVVAEPDGGRRRPPAGPALRV